MRKHNWSDCFKHIKMSDYYSKKLSSDRLKRCYDIAPPRTKQYLSAEIEYVLNNISKSDSVLELGCGYGRVLEQLIQNSSIVIGIDISLDSLILAKQYISLNPKLQSIQANAIHLPFSDESFDKVICIQNGISAFKVDPVELIQESIRVTKVGGVCLFSSYSEKFWTYRVTWFQLQADAGLIGEIDRSQTVDGVIVCKDGFKATTFTSNDFQNIIDHLGVDATMFEVDESSIFCRIEKNE